MIGTTQPNPMASLSVSAAVSAAPTGAGSGHQVTSSTPDELPQGKKTLADDPRVPAWLVSTIVHTLLLLLLALLSKSSANRDGLHLSGRQSETSPSVTLQVTSQPQNKPTHTQSQSEETVSVIVAPQQSLIAEIDPLDRPDSENENVTELLLQSLAGGTSGSRAMVSPLPGGGLSGRTPERRRELGQKYGATPESEEAVELALKYLAAHQRRGGGWSFDLSLQPCDGRCSNSKLAGQDPTPSTAATGLAMLAFMGAGYTHQSGPYAENLHNAIYYLRNAYGETESGYDWQQGSMYGHGIALMALAEALSMTTDEEEYDTLLKDLVEMGTLFTVIAQHPNGSWGYTPGSPGDTTLTGWQILSLLAAKRNHIALRSHTLRDAKDFLLTMQGEKAFSFGYRTPKAEPTTTAIGLTMMLYLGESPHTTAMHLALSDVVERGPAKTNIYHDYYATLALHHARHYGWDEWNQQLRDHLVASQVKTGHEAGSWHFDNHWGNIGGRLYTTAMCAMTLEIYYRYLPLYESMEKFPL